MARQRWVVAVLAISLGTIACKKQDGAKPDTKGSAAEKTDPGAAKKDAPASQVQGDLGLLPVDAEAVVGVNWGQLQASPLWKQFVEPEMKKDSDFMAGLDAFKEHCGIDLMGSVKHVALGLKNLGADTPEGVVVLHGLDKAKSMACVDKWEKAAADHITFKKDGDVVTILDKDGVGGAFTFLGDNRMLLVIANNVDSAAVKKAAQGGSTLSTSPAFVDMYGKINKDQSAWFLLNGSSKVFDDAQQGIGVRPKAVFGSLHVTDAMSADVRARLESADQATQTAANFNGQVQAMAAMFDKLDFASDGADVKLSAAASNAKLQALFKMFAAGGM